MTQTDTHLNPLGPAEPVLVVGMGVTGLSVARYLARRGVPFSIVDSRQQPPGVDALHGLLPAENIYTGEIKPSLLDAARTLIVSPGIGIQQPMFDQARANGASIIGDIELFAREVQVPVIAVTGSNGKTTVTDLLGKMAQQAGVKVQVGGNIGTPVLDVVDDKSIELFVLELSSFQLETTDSLNARAAVILNITEDHMDRYRGMDDYAAAKARIFQGDGVLIANRDDARVMAFAEALPQRQCITFTLQQPAADQYGICVKDQVTWLCKGEQCLLDTSELKIKGTHNMANALAALAMGETAGLSMSSMLDTLRSYTGLPHRMQWVAEKDGVNWFNDSKATNVGATLAAIAGAPAQKLVLIAGGQGKGQDFSPLQAVIAARVSHLILLGEDAKLIAQYAPASVNTLFVKDMQAAVSTAARVAESGDAVLLSPACASFDMFRGYEHRGEVFMQLVREQLA
ncbi:MAG: UDP-N-acetylmuramoyl-L-alanine--D-glutamate ligase [Gammaproteobacteria bacterium]|nr:UDP-N-acetylmuramoyl-L-alanine--D-glutamate ligase [Gammaproteobacteria bacterium]MDH5651522.1 UDP-N-acetylmuramoyl-L-alanine--D-glutamate ligase [Gammaproteobacteria bacterium]